jgi:hypothetical protein
MYQYDKLCQLLPPPLVGSVLYLAGPVWTIPQRWLQRQWAGQVLRTSIRIWVFMGSRERCTRHVSSDPIVKASNIISRTLSEVPAALRAERARLGFDFGKFDFVIHEGQPILLDANRTPGSSPALREFLLDGARNLADGLEELIYTPVPKEPEDWRD